MPSVDDDREKNEVFLKVARSAPGMRRINRPPGRYTAGRAVAMPVPPSELGPPVTSEAREEDARTGMALHEMIR